MLGPSLLLQLALTANAQRFDASAPALPPDTVDVRDPVHGYSGAASGAPTLMLWAESSSAMLVRRLAQGDTAADSPVVDDVAGGRLGFSTGLHKRLGFGLVLPVWVVDADGEVDSGVAPGDLSVWLPLGLIETESFRLGVVPFGALPTGDPQRYLGELGPLGGALGSAALDAGPLVLGGDVGFDYTGPTGVDEWPGGPHLRYATDVGVVASERVGLHAELRSRLPLGPGTPSLPLEAMATLKVNPSERVSIVGGAGRGVTRGIGVSAFRMLLGLSVAPGTKDIEEPIIGTPPPLSVLVVDERSLPITNARVEANGFEGLTDYEGYAELPPAAFRKGVAVISHPHYQTEEVALEEAKRDAWEIELVRKPVDVLVSVVGPQGALMEVVVDLDGPYDPGPPVLDAAGVHTWQLEPGTWFVRMASPGLGSQERTILIEEERVEPIRVDAVLASNLTADSRVRVEVVDRLGRPVEDAVVALEDRDLGTTGTGGDVVIEGLRGGGHDLMVRSERLGERANVRVIVDEGTGEKTVQAVVDWRPGSVQVKATNPRGKPVDATVNFVGPSNLPQRGIGSDGDEIFVLRPGSWDVEVTAPGMGTQVRTIEVTEDEGDLVVVDVGLIGEERGDGAMKVRLYDEHGAPASGVDVFLDGDRVGTTGREGTLELQDLRRGERTLTWGGDLVEPQERVVTLQKDGIRVIDGTARFREGVAEVRVSDSKGRPIDAKVKIDGPAQVPAGRIGVDGAERYLLGEGRWAVRVSAEGYEPQERIFTVSGGDRDLQELGFVLARAGSSGTVSVSVVDPRGRPVEGAEVQLDGGGVGRAGDGGELVSGGIATGRVEVGAVAEGMRPAAVDARVERGELSEVEVALEWAPGALEVVPTGPDGEPVDDVTITLRDASGEAVVPPRTVDGATVIAAEKGSYKMLVEAPGMRTQVVDVDVSGAAELTTAEVALAPRDPESGAAVVLTAEDEQGRALVNADVLVKGEVVGKTDATGTVEVEGLRAGRWDLEIVPEAGRMHAQTEVVVPVGRVDDKGDREVRTTVVVEDAARPVVVQVEDAEGKPVEAEIVAVQGSRDAGEVDVDPGESGTLALKPGSYTITARTDDGQLATTDLVVPKLQSDDDPSAAFIPGMDLDGRSADGVAAVRVEGDTPFLSMRVETIQASVAEGTIVPVAPILFDTDRATLRADAQPLIRDLALWLKAHREASLVEVGGHTDDVGGVVYNQQLSERRAKSVRLALIELGVAPERLEARGYGLSRPVTANVDRESRQSNRRVELAVQDWIEQR